MVKAVVERYSYHTHCWFCDSTLLYNERDIERYINMPNENLYPTRYSEWCSENEKTSSETKDCDDGLPF